MVKSKDIFEPIQGQYDTFVSAREAIRDRYMQYSSQFTGAFTSNDLVRYAIQFGFLVKTEKSYHITLAPLAQ